MPDQCCLRWNTLHSTEGEHTGVPLCVSFLCFMSSNQQQAEGVMGFHPTVLNAHQHVVYVYLQSMWHNLKLVKLKSTLILGFGDFGIMVAILVFWNKTWSFVDERVELGSISWSDLTENASHAVVATCQSEDSPALHHTLLFCLFYSIQDHNLLNQKKRRRT